MALSAKDVNKAIRVLSELRENKLVEIQSTAFLSAVMYTDHDALLFDYNSIDRVIALLKKYQLDHIYDPENIYENTRVPDKFNLLKDGLNDEFKDS